MPSAKSLFSWRFSEFVFRRCGTPLKKLLAERILAKIKEIHNKGKYSSQAGQEKTVKPHASFSPVIRATALNYKKFEETTAQFEFGERGVKV